MAAHVTSIRLQTLSTIAKVRRHLRIYAPLCLLLLVALVPRSVYAGDRVVVLLSRDNSAYIRVEQTLAHTLSQRAHDAVELSVDFLSDSPIADWAGAKLIVAVGVRASLHALQHTKSTPVLSVLIPEVTYAALRKTDPGRSLQTAGAIYLDQPVGRQLDLARLLIPDLQQLGVLLGPSSRRRLGALQKAARVRNINLQIGEIEPRDNPIVALNPILDGSDALLAEPDPVVFNRGDLEGILLSTYRMGVPVIGFSYAYVRAGALAAVYSTPQQIGRQAAEMISRMVARGQWRLPKPSYPAYYTVTVNRQVARSLRLNVPTGRQLHAELEKLERPQ